MAPRLQGRCLFVLFVGLVLGSPLCGLTQPLQPALIPFDIDLPSDSAGGARGTLAVRVCTPQAGGARYADGAPIVIWLHGGVDVGGLNHGLPDSADDVICITFVYPGGEDPVSGRSSDGVYDYRGENCIAALRDVVLYAAGEIRDAQGRTLDEILPVPVLHDDILLIGESNGGNIVVAVAALYGQELSGHLRSIIQWETPVSSQIATCDLGHVWFKGSPAQADYWNPRILGYDPLVIPVNYGDLTVNPDATVPVFHDGDGDGDYTTVLDPFSARAVPDLDGNGILSVDEDFPLDVYPVNDREWTYSRPVMNWLESTGQLARVPLDLVSAEAAETYWDLRESVRLYDRAVANIPDLSAMVLCSVRDHVQTTRDKPHIRQAYDGWSRAGAWVKINPSLAALRSTNAIQEALAPDLPANTAPPDWSDLASYALPVSADKARYELAAIYEMADRVHESRSATSPEAPAAARNLNPGEHVAYLPCSGVGQVAVLIREPAGARYPEGAPVVVNVSGFFTGTSGFDLEWDPDAVGALYVTYVWPGQTDLRTGASSEGTFDYGGPDCLAALRDVVRFALGGLAAADGRCLDEIVQTKPLYDVVGLYAFSHSGIAATNVLCLHGRDLAGVDFFVGRENPTTDALYPLEPGYWSGDGSAVLNPFYDPAEYTPTSIGIDYSTVYWSDDDERPAFHVAQGPDYVCSPKHPRMWSKDYWSADLLQALLDNGALTRDAWPLGLATPEEARDAWSTRTTVDNYPLLSDVLPDLKVMLVFAADDHVQTAIDKPHIHQAYDGFHNRAGLWCRMNPDRSYVEAVLGRALTQGVPDNPANQEPSSWLTIRQWGYGSSAQLGFNGNVLVPIAAVAEMCDRTYTGDWSATLDDVLPIGNE